MGSRLIFSATPSGPAASFSRVRLDRSVARAAFPARLARSMALFGSRRRACPPPDRIVAHLQQVINHNLTFLRFNPSLPRLGGALGMSQNE
jgi:hypothetical protein